MKRFILLVPLIARWLIPFVRARTRSGTGGRNNYTQRGTKSQGLSKWLLLSRVLKNKPALVTVKCNAPTPIIGASLQASPAVNKTLNAGQTLKIKSNNCNLHINKQKPAKVIVVCQPKITTVDVGHNGFSFFPQQVNIKIGETVHWDWVSSNHTVTSGTAPTADGTFCSPNNTTCGTANPSNSGATYEHQFNSAGTFDYFCKIHGAAMTGTVVVSP